MLLDSPDMMYTLTACYMYMYLLLIGLWVAFRHASGYRPLLNNMLVKIGFQVTEMQIMFR